MIDVVRGVLRIRKWPKKRGRAKSESQRFWIDWFKQANLLAKYADAMSVARAKEITANTGMYPRDIMLAAMRGRLYTWVDQNGWRWYPVAAKQDISESLDVLAQTIGSILFRATDLWRSPLPGNAGEVMLNQGGGNLPIWSPAPGLGGVVTEDVPGSPIFPDNTQNTYTLDVSNYASTLVKFNSVGFALADRGAIRFSVDGGASYQKGVNDYTDTFLLSASSGTANTTEIESSTVAALSGHILHANIMSLRAGGASVQLMAGIAGGVTVARSVVANFLLPITNIEIRSVGGNNFNIGAILVVGTR